MSQTSVAPRAFRADISRIDKYVPAELLGRETETNLLNDAWEKAVRGESNRPRILTFVALGGEGKTSLVAKWLADLAYKNWPGCDMAFAWSFYSQGTRDQVAASSDLFLKDALTFFEDAELAGSAQNAYEKGRRLAQLVGKQRALLILDGLEPLLYASTSSTPGGLKDQGMAALLKGLAATSHGLCVVTTRYALPDLRAFIGKTVREERLARLSREAGVALLQSFGLKGSLWKNIHSADGRELWNEFEELVEDVKGHALTLNLLASYLRDAHAGDIRKRDLVKLEEADAEEQGGHAFRVMDAYVKWLEQEEAERESGAPVDSASSCSKGQRALATMHLLGLFDRPATSACLNALLKSPAIPGLTEPLVGLGEAQINLALSRLEFAKLLTVNRDEAGALLALDAHPLVREYFAQRLRNQCPEAWRAAHRRLFEHLCATTKEGDQPKLEDLQPLYQAVAHGCHAGLQQKAWTEVYDRRILKLNESYSWQKLGVFGSDLGAVTCFFETQWVHLSQSLEETTQALLLSLAGFFLRALGRVNEALLPIQTALEIGVKREDWEPAAARACNLSEAELTLGNLTKTESAARLSESYADQSDDLVTKLTSRCKVADALHQKGCSTDSNALFCEAERMHAKGQPDNPLLSSLNGFQYCDLLLAEAEHGAWRAMLGTKEPYVLKNESCQGVLERAAKTLKWTECSNRALLDAALDQLTLDRASLYQALIGGAAQAALCSGLPPKDEAAPGKRFASACVEVGRAVASLRRAGQIDYLPRGLLTRAWLRSLVGARTGPESAQEDLDEAWEIAERGPMKLHMADIHLYRARLFGMRNSERGTRNEDEKYPWDKNPDGTARGPKDDLAAARKLIEQCGYWRRKGELEDAEKAILG